VGPIAATDPLWPPNLAATSTTAPATLGRKTNDIMLGSWKPKQ
jgi:hypothetical protein